MNLTVLSHAEQGSQTHTGRTHRPAHLPAYVRTHSLHSGNDAWEAGIRCRNFEDTLSTRDEQAYNEFQQLLTAEGHPADYGRLTIASASAVAKLAQAHRTYGDDFAADSAELALNASGYLLQPDKQTSVAQSIQADIECRRMAEIRELLAATG